MRTLTVEKIGETEKAVQYRVTFWIVENPDTLCAGKEKSITLGGGYRSVWSLLLMTLI